MSTRDALAIALLVGAIGVGCSDTPAPAVDGDEASTGSEPMAATDPEPAPPETVADLFPEGEGRSLVLDTCGSCHAVACSVTGQRTLARWEGLKDDHRDKASNLAEEDLDSIFAYLSGNFNDSTPEPMVPAHFLDGGCTPY